MPFIPRHPRRINTFSPECEALLINAFPKSLVSLHYGNSPVSKQEAELKALANVRPQHRFPALAAYLLGDPFLNGNWLEGVKSWEVSEGVMIMFDTDPEGEQAIS